MDKLYIKAVEVKKTATAKGKKKPVDTLKASAFKVSSLLLVLSQSWGLFTLFFSEPVP